ncbi:MAG TPA: hypothetical protein VFF28_06175 [Candidatus Nanoarchaeia archaeon]|nr:hypothetical protein [Candidatus Nanoarchaeia archaeon]
MVKKEIYWKNPELEKQKVRAFYKKNREKILSKLRRYPKPEDRPMAKCERCGDLFKPLSNFHPNERFCLGCKLERKRERNRDRRPKTYKDGWDTIKFLSRNPHHLWLGMNA